MHPIVTSITNGVPFFSFDNYGIPVIEGKRTNGESSKIYHILKQADLLDYRIFTCCDDYSPIIPKDVLDKVIHFDVLKEVNFAKSYYEQYERMMKSVYINIKMK